MNFVGPMVTGSDTSGVEVVASPCSSDAPAPPERQPSHPHHLGDTDALVEQQLTTHVSTGLQAKQRPTLDSFIDSLRLSLGQPLIASSPLRRTTHGVGDVMPCRSVRIVASSHLRHCNLEIQAKKVLLRKWRPAATASPREARILPMQSASMKHLGSLCPLPSVLL